MPSVSQILGCLLVLAALLMGAHEVWLHTRHDSESRTINRPRLRRRLTGVVFMLALVALTTWAGGMVQGDPATAKIRLVLYGISLLLAIALVGLAYADARATSRLILCDMLGDDDAAMLEDPHVREIMAKMSGKKMSSEEMERLSAELEQSLPEQGQSPEG